MTKIETWVDRLQDGYREAPRRKIKEMGNIEFFELGETVRTTQCPSCLRFSEEWTVSC